MAVALGFPDILYNAPNAYVRILERQAATQADVVLGLFPADRPQKVDMVDLGEGDRVRQIDIKPSQTHLQYTWGVAVWTPTFTRFMHNFLATRKKDSSHQTELFMGHVFQAAMKDGIRVEAVSVSSQPYIDIGTPEDLIRATRSFGCSVQ